MSNSNYIELKDLEVYQLARELSTVAWAIYEPMDINTKKTMGDQFLKAMDSIGANIVEGYGRYHYLDKIKFYYNSRASLFEACEHWADLIKERNMMSQEQFDQIQVQKDRLRVKLNNFISTTYKTYKENKK
ncbi:MAG: four helix bundle protein [Bacteroidetes bacterium SW_10_40_5]|nr:MAG: four helix bundle protein [Bacteroidetes bacterium SW_10_40_5]